MIYKDSTSASKKRARNNFPILALATQGRKPDETKEAQYLLKHNRYGVVFYSGDIDGVFSPAVADACRAAKLWLGYPSNQVKGVFGPQLRSYLVPNNHPACQARPKSYIKTAAIRAQKPFRVTVIERAEKEMGYTESPVNITKFGALYGMNGVAWCCIFVSCMIGFDKFKYSYVPYVEADAKAGRNHLHITETPQEGDCVLFDWNKDGTPDHIGFFGGWIDQKAGSFWTVEGNTGPEQWQGNQSNGDGVYKRTRYMSEVACFVSYS